MDVLNADVDPRRRVEQCLAAEEWEHARASLTAFWRQADAATAAFVVSRFERLRPHLSLIPSRVAVLRSFTVEPLIPLLRAEAFVSGMALEMHVGDFGVYAQEMLRPDSALYQFAPQVVLLAVEARDIVPGCVSLRGLSRANRGGGGTGSRWIPRLGGRVRFSQAHLVIHSLDEPSSLRDSSMHKRMTVRAAPSAASIGTQQIAKAQAGMYVLDYTASSLMRTRAGTTRDGGSARVFRSPATVPVLARRWVRLLHPLLGRVCKVLVTDLDQTLWGGVVGEDGFDGIVIGDDERGAPHQSLQRALLDLHRRGILLAVCSKNNRDDAMEVLERHPGMLVRPEHFAALEINWRDKAENLRAIAAGLNRPRRAGADDNPVERARVQAELRVTIIELPDDRSASRRRGARGCPVFERLSPAEEDRQRARYYADQRQRAQLEQQMTSVEVSIALDLKIDVDPVVANTVQRWRS
jgi:HAD superfamily phosphatase (TIGR01681 family)